MTRTAVLWLLAASALGQEEAAEPLYARCDTGIAWITDGVTLPDCESLGRRRGKPVRDPEELLEEAKARAVKEKKLILWYVPRQNGGHMNRVAMLDAYLKVVVFSDPDVIDVVNRSFVPLRCCLNAALSSDFELKRFAFLEPGFVFLAPDGRIVHTVDRLRTFNAEWCLALFRAVLDSKPEYRPAAGDPPGKPYLQAVEARRKRDGAAALKLLDGDATPEGLAEKGRVLLHLGRLDEARAPLERSAAKGSPRQAEAIYWLAHLDRLSQKPDPARDRWRRLMREFAKTPWAARAASNFVAREDTLPMGPAMHNFEDALWPPDGAFQALPASTRWARAEGDAEDAVKRAVAWLLAHQDGSGAWTDSRYVYCDSPKILPNVIMSVTALSAAALWEWREHDPKRIDAALARADKFIADERNMARRHNEESYADAYRLLYWSRRAASGKGEEKKKALAPMSAVAAALAKQQKGGGFFWHEYTNPFCTAAVVMCLAEARKAGAAVDNAMIARAVDALAKVRSEDGRFPYSGGPASAPADSSSRSPMCEAAMFHGGASTKEKVAAALDLFFQFLDKQEAIRVTDFHADGQLGGFFFFHGFFHATEAARLIDPEPREARMAKFRAHLLKMPEFDGSYLDSHELGKSYGTAMALLSWKNAWKK